MAGKPTAVASDSLTQPSNVTGKKTRKRKRDAELSPADVREEVRGPVTRGKQSRGSTGIVAESQVKERKSMGKAGISDSATAADSRDSKVSLDGPVLIDLTQTDDDCDNVPCVNVDEYGSRVEKQEKPEQVLMMQRSSSRKGIANSVDLDLKANQESLPQGRKNGSAMDRLKAGVLLKEETTGGLVEERRASSFDKGKNIQRAAHIEKPMDEQKAVPRESKGAALGAEHLQDSRPDNTGLATELAQDGLGSNDVTSRIDTSGKYFLVATNPTETGGRQMRPRPLDLEQPLLVLIEGRDQDYYDLDGGAFNRMLQHQLETRKPPSEPVNKGTLQALEKQDGRTDSIVIPSVRSLPEYAEVQQRLRSTYAIPESYVKASAMTANEYNSQAEYDIDEEDEGWLCSFNQIMHDLGMASILSEDQFENLMEILENKAADLENLESSPLALDQGYFLHGTMRQLSEECCICNGGENSANNLVFKCADCGILVHQSCYGIQASDIYARDKQWYCRKCESVATGKAMAGVRCALCCKQGGALKPATEAFKWVHVVCALYTNETFFVNADNMEPVDGLVAADARARKQRRRCWLCGLKEGSAERCSVKTCEAVFHVSCGVTQGASFELQHSNQQVVHVRAFCSKHANVAPVSSNVKQKGFYSTKEDIKSSLSGGFKERLLTNGEEMNKHDLLSKQRDQRKRDARTPQAAGHVEDKTSVTHINSPFVGDDCKCISLRHRMVAPDCAKQRYFDGKSKERHALSEAYIDLDSLETVNLKEKVIEKAIELEDPVLSFKDALELDGAAPEFIEGVYWYWTSKRAKCGGPLLHQLQQERAAKNFGIFNSNATFDYFSSSPFQGIGLRHTGMNLEIRQKMVSIRQQLQKLKELAHLIVRREKIRLDIHFIDLDISQLLLDDLKGTGISHNCSSCKGRGFAVQCMMCNRDFCVQCFKSKKGDGSRGWLAALKLLKYLCFGCQERKHQEDELFASRASYLAEENETNCKSCEERQIPVKNLPSLVNPGFEQEQHTTECHNNEVCDVRKDKLFQSDHEKVIDGALASTDCAPKKPKILYPPSELNSLDTSACEAFWESVEQQSHCNKTVLVSELLKATLSKSYEDVANAAKNHPKNSFRRKT